VDPIDWDNEHIVWLNGIIYRITPEGIVLSVWNLQKSAYDVKNWAIGPTGCCLAVITWNDIFYYSSTGKHTGNCNISEIRSRPIGAKFKAIAFKKDNSETTSIISVVTKGHITVQDVYSTDKNQCELHLRDWNFVVKNTALKSKQKIEMKSSIAKSDKPYHHWYDEERGLVFSPYRRSLTVHRITYY